MRCKSDRLCSVILILAVLLSSSAALAQVGSKEQEKELEKQKELERKTLTLMDEIVSAAWGLKLPENRSLVLATAADLLWPHDERRARNLFWEALNNLNLPSAALAQPAKVIGRKEAKDPNANDSAAKKPADNDPARKPAAKSVTAKGPTKEQIEELTRYYTVFQKRREFLRRVARRDSQLALDMLHATRQQAPAQLPGYLKPQDDTDLEEEIAGISAARDPKRALEIARQSLSKG